MTLDPKDNAALRSLFSAARNETPDLDDKLTDGILAGVPDAPTHIVRQPASTPTFLQNWLPAIGGLGVATALGVWIGVVVPVSSILSIDALDTADTLNISAFYAGADPTLFLTEEADL